MKFLFKFVNYDSLIRKQDFLNIYYYHYYYYNFLKLFYLYSMFFLNSNKKFYLFKLAFLYFVKFFDFLNLIKFSKIFFFLVKYFDLSFSCLANLDVSNVIAQYLPSRLDQFSLLRSSFIYKKSQEQFGKTRFLSFFSFQSYFFFNEYYYYSLGRFYKKINLMNFLSYKINSL